MIYNRIKPMVEERFQVPVIGYLPELNFLQVGSRHLGLVLPDEIDGIRQQLEQLADRMDDNLEWEPLLKIAADAGGRDWAVPVREEAGAGQETGNAAGIKPGNELGNKPENIPHFRLGIARDEAFCFYYEDNLKAMEQAGARLVYFSPLHQKQLPEGLDGLILGAVILKTTGRLWRPTGPCGIRWLRLPRPECPYWQSAGDTSICWTVWREPTERFIPWQGF